MARVIVETPYAGDIEGNLEYLRACMRHCALRGESPYASHAILTQPGVLDDGNPEERRLGIRLGFEWRLAAERTVFYLDRGVSSGMRAGYADALRVGCPVAFRSLYNMPQVELRRLALELRQ